ncbi:MAG: SMP-30/gluconolactonase/LRE family protein [Propionicimonas sp.]
MARECDLALVLITTPGETLPVDAEPAAGSVFANGLGWSPDTETLYLNDSGVGTTWAFDWDPIEGASGRCVDAEGGVWTARYGGGRVSR